MTWSYDADESISSPPVSLSPLLSGRHVPATMVAGACWTSTCVPHPSQHALEVAAVATHYLVSPGNTRNWSDDGVLG